MKKIMKRFLTAVLSVTMITGLTACTGSADVMKEAAENMSKVSSMSYDMTMDMEMSAAGQTIPMKTTSHVDCFSEPLMLKMDTSMDASIGGSYNTQAYMTEEDGKCVMYTGMEIDGETTWTKQELLDVDAVKQYDAKASLEMYIKNIDSFEENGTEEINGSKATRYDGVIKSDMISDVMEYTGMNSQMDGLGLGADDISSMFKDGKDMSISMWLDDEKKIPVKYEMDLTDMMQSIMDKLSESQDAGAADSVTISKVFISSTISNFDAVESFTIPQDVIDNAQSMSN